MSVAEVEETSRTNFERGLEEISDEKNAMYKEIFNRQHQDAGREKKTLKKNLPGVSEHQSR